MEDNRPDDIDKVFEDGLEPFRRMPSKAVWDNIEQQLDQDDRNIFVVRLRFSLLAAAALLILFSGSELYFHSALKNAGVTNHTFQSGSLKKEVTRAGDGSGHIILPSPSRVRDINAKTGKQFLPATQMQSAEPQPYVENNQNSGPVSISGIENSLPPARSPIDMQPQSIDSRWDVPTFDPAQRALPLLPVGLKKAASLIALQKLRRWSVTAYYTSELAGYNLSDRDSLAANGKEIDKREKHLLSTTAEIFVNYRFSDHWVIQTGIGYSWARSHASPTTSYAVSNDGEIKFQVNTLSGYGYVPSSSSSPAQVGDTVAIEHSTTTLHYINAPFMLSYGLHLKRFTLMPGVGVSLNFLTGATLETKLRSASNGQQDYTVTMYGLKRINYGMLVKTELVYGIDSHWSLNMVASFKNSLTPINLHTVVATYPYNLGVGAGVRYSF